MSRSRDPNDQRNTRAQPDHERIRAALAAAREHATRAAFEALAAARALLDAATLAATGRDAATQPGVDVLAQMLDDFGASLGADHPGEAGPLHHALYLALDSEIKRWEQRAGNDVEARAVLRAFIGLREILWELGVQPPEQSAPDARTKARSRTAPKREPSGQARRQRQQPTAAPQPRVQRIVVDG